MTTTTSSGPSGSSGSVEEVVLVDDAGHAIGTAAKAGVHGPDTPLHLAFSCYVFDADGRLLLTQRAHEKPTWGGVWTNSACGHPAPGESAEAAVRRRVRQELGLELDDLTLVLPRFRYRAVMGDGTVEHELCPVFVARAASSLALDAAEVADHVWVEWGSFRAEVLAGTRDVSPWCVEQVTALPADPLAAPAADPAELPPAAR
ncbi:isopentenyl-diphosphate Delta-isomerase [Nocardioides flavescens]|uniref:Isopentenyl-diphosphate Delta-isomerase n=1 Tax=Nocardioides flavescens TaxID=2691959 RepID=A0A6L7EQN1_9ACTN|nr:isopentenyl-diphosphate Delta-isomerase [Nocardioides flavescens]MXG89717.1 isopentenyl-diphosphate Delta-isomerase [Nocardioides flavescens]